MSWRLFSPWDPLLGHMRWYQRPVLQIHWDLDASPAKPRTWLWLMHFFLCKPSYSLSSQLSPGYFIRSDSKKKKKKKRHISWNIILVLQYPVRRQSDKNLCSGVWSQRALTRAGWNQLRTGGILFGTGSVDCKQMSYHRIIQAVSRVSPCWPVKTSSEMRC